MATIQTLLESSNEYKSMQRVANRLTSKWTQSGLLEGLDKRSKGVVAVMLENQAKQIIAEANATSIGGSTFQAGEGEQWAGVALPLVRKIFGQIAAKDFLSVQPLNLPSGLAFFLEFKYGDTRNGRKDGDNMYGNLSTATRKMQVNEDVNGGLYGAGQFGYTINDKVAEVTPVTVAIDDVIAAATPETKDLALYMFGGQLGAAKTLRNGISVANAKIYKVEIKDELKSIDAEGIRAFRLLDKKEYDATSYVNTWNEFTYLRREVKKNTDPATKDRLPYVEEMTLYFLAPEFLEDGVTANLTPAAMLYHVQPVDNNRGDYEAASGRAVDQSIVIPEIDVKLASVPIVAKTRKLKAQWTPEFAQDLNAYHSIDAEAELTSILSEYISMEIDLELLDMLIADAVTVDYWSARNNTFWDGKEFKTSLATADFPGYYNTQGGWFQTLGTKMQKVSNKVHQKTMRGGCTFAVCSPTVATILESIPGYAASTDGDKEQFAMGVQKVGSLNSRFQVYKNPYMLENVILMGYKGSQFLECGAVYSPYIPLLMTPLVYDPETFTPRKGLMTRYAKKMLRPEFYAKIYVSGLETV